MSSFPKQVSLHGQRAYITPDNELVAQKSHVSGGERSIGRQGGNVVIPGAPGVVAHFHDFLGDLIPDELQYFEGDTGHSAAIAVATNGLFRMTTSTTAAKTPAAVLGVNEGIKANWKANQGALRMSARLKMSAKNGGQNIFVGFTDTGGTEMPFHDTGAATIVSTASNAVGWLYGGAGATANVWTGIGVKANTDKTPVTGDVPVVNKFDVLEVRIGDTGSDGSGDVAYFYQNGILKGSITSPVTTTTALYPVIAAFSKDTGGWFVDVDYFNCSANRDTGA